MFKTNGVYYTNKYYIIIYCNNIFDIKINEMVLEHMFTNINNFNHMIGKIIYSHRHEINYSQNIQYINDNNSSSNLSSNLLTNTSDIDSIDIKSDECVYGDEDSFNDVLTEYDMMLDDFVNIEL
jgi:hypothetical protein